MSNSTCCHFFPIHVASSLRGNKLQNFGYNHSWGASLFFDFCSLLLIVAVVGTHMLRRAPGSCFCNFFNHPFAPCWRVRWYLFHTTARSLNFFQWQKHDQLASLDFFLADVGCQWQRCSHQRRCKTKQNKNLGAFYFVRFFPFHSKRSFVIFSFLRRGLYLGPWRMFFMAPHPGQEGTLVSTFLLHLFFFFLVGCHVIFAPKAVDAAERSHKDGGGKEEGYAQASSHWRKSLLVFSLCPPVSLSLPPPRAQPIVTHFLRFSMLSEWAHVSAYHAPKLTVRTSGSTQRLAFLCCIIRFRIGCFISLSCISLSFSLSLCKTIRLFHRHEFE